MPRRNGTGSAPTIRIRPGLKLVIAVVVVLEAHQEGPHPFGDQHQGDAYDEAEYREEAEHPLDREMAVLGIGGISEEQGHADRDQGPDDLGDVWGIVEQIAPFGLIPACLRHDFHPAPSGCRNAYSRSA